MTSSMDHFEHVGEVEAPIAVLEAEFNEQLKTYRPEGPISVVGSLLPQPQLLLQPLLLLSARSEEEWATRGVGEW